MKDVKTYTIGLLECDHVRPEFLSIAGDYRDMFPNLFHDVAPHFQFRFYDVVNGSFPEKASDCDAYLSTGSSFSVYENVPWIHQLADFVRTLADQRIPYIGICFGHQMIGHALGGKVGKAPVGWCVGVHTFNLKKEKKWMDPVQDTFNLLMMCQDQILELPPNTDVLASTDDCPHAMILWKEHILGIQAHPEFPAAYDQALIELRRERISDEKVERGIDSLRSNIDDQLVAQWIVNFLSNLQESE